MDFRLDTGKGPSHLRNIKAVGCVSSDLGMILQGAELRSGAQKCLAVCRDGEGDIPRGALCVALEIGACLGHLVRG